MKICICTTPIRRVPTSFPPFGAMAVIQSLRDSVEEVQFYNIDFHRPSEEQVKDFFSTHQFDAVGISAVVSTAYAYTKDLTRWIRSVSPQSTIIIGGNLAVSSEILLRKCHVDFCVIGDGEIIIKNLIDYLQSDSLDYKKLYDIRGIAFLDTNNIFHFTGYEKPLSPQYIPNPDYAILQDDKSLHHYISDNVVSHFDGIIPEEEVDGKKFTTLITSKGCINRCTFCHRWEKGYRLKSVEDVVDHLGTLKDTYDVGFVSIGDENFGSARRLTRELVSKIGTFGITWRCAGVRVQSVDPEILRFWHENGCRSVIFGTESGSQKMLDIMEKNSTVENNFQALKWSHEVGLSSVVQLVIGMPGEDDKTIGETIDFLTQVLPYLSIRNGTSSEVISINYAQALPGTPLYEYARQHGHIGESLEDEEEYLYSISDIDAYSSDHFINFTGLPLLKVHVWRAWILAAVEASYLQHFHKLSLSLWQVAWVLSRYFFLWCKNRGGLLARFASMIPPSLLAREPIRPQVKRQDGPAEESGYFNIQAPYFVCLFLNRITRKLFYPILSVGVAFALSGSIGEYFAMIREHLEWSLKNRLSWRSTKQNNISALSLRKQVNILAENRIIEQEGSMIALRRGR